MAPDRPGDHHKAAVATNHRKTSNAIIPRTVHRDGRSVKDTLPATAGGFTGSEKKSSSAIVPSRRPLYSHSSTQRLWPTLYTAVYSPEKREMEHRWARKRVWHQKLDCVRREKGHAMC